MTAPARFLLGDDADFREACEAHAWFVAEGWVPLHVAVDNLQRLAERWALVEAFGDDVVQRWMAVPFARRRGMPEPIDPQEIPLQPQPPPSPSRRAGPARSTIDAFLWLALHGDVERLPAWLAAHPTDAPHLHQIWKKRCSAPATATAA